MLYALYLFYYIKKQPAGNLTMPDVEIIRGNVIEVINYLSENKKKGECVIVIAGAEESKKLEF